MPETDHPGPQPLRLWPGVALVILQWALWLALPRLVLEDMALLVGVLGGLTCGLAVALWWVCFSRAPRGERWGGVATMLLALFATPLLLHESIRTGNVGMMFAIHAVPAVSLAFVLWAVVFRHWESPARHIAMVTAILLGCLPWTLLRSDGIDGRGAAQFRWRWSATDEEQLLAESEESFFPLTTVGRPGGARAKWPGFRGCDRDGLVRETRIATDWSASPPEELWRRRIGPGCSSFAVEGTLFYTQEQRGELECVSCHLLTTGQPVWRHEDEVRFYDSHAGAGPRATPTLVEDRLYTLGATGVLNAFVARDGDLLWSRSCAEDAEVEPPSWGFTGSPLVHGDLVLVAASGTLLAYDSDRGELRWRSEDGGSSYSSPHLVTLDGAPQVVLMSELGARSFAPGDGKLLWTYEWPGGDRIVQPAQVSERDLLLCGGGMRLSMRRLGAALEDDAWKVTEHWTSHGLKPNHYDFVAHEGHVFGFNGPRLACIEAESGERVWRSGRLTGFVLLLADQDLLLVLTEDGELVLVDAKPDGFLERARLPAIDGKTWSHPVLVGDTVLVRNARQMAAFRLPSLDS